ncbi:helix-turn-helix domain-containing protein [Sediminibacillus massiliensis]|uniref:helix-turn-helix domain-containing protein n=1 Tax=Sediminibacillus massiliensis TaxID=1926277 RepID=UPI0009888BB8|nr:helix-turn-helix domain-containing protein [Sediminibacillus massiliensis]
MYLKLSFEVLHEYQTFSTKAEMDSTIYSYINHLRSIEAPESTIEVLRFFGRSSLRVLGVSFAKYQTIADCIGVSKRTVIRAVNRLEEAGMIERIATVKKWRRSVNVIQILPSMSIQGVTSTEQPEGNEDKSLNEESKKEPSLLNHNYNYGKQRRKNKEPEQERSADNPEALRQSIPKAIYDKLAPFFDANGLYKTYGILLRAKASVDKYITLEDHAEDFTDVFLNAIRKAKRGIVGNLDGYLYASWTEVCRVIKRREAFEAGENLLAYNWLNS